MLKWMSLFAVFTVGCGSTPPPPIDYTALNAEAMARPLRKPASRICRDRSVASLRSSAATSPTLRYTEAPKGFCKKADVRGVVAANSSQIRACYEDALTRNPKLAGKVKMRWRIQLDGTVTQTSVLGFSLEDEPMMVCMCNVISAWLFPKPNGGMCQIKYPFIFTAGDVDQPTPRSARSTPPGAL